MILLALFGVAIYCAEGIYAAWEEVRFGSFLGPALLSAIWVSNLCAATVLWLSLRPPLPIMQREHDSASDRQHPRERYPSDTKGEAATSLSVMARLSLPMRPPRAPTRRVESRSSLLASSSGGASDVDLQYMDELDRVSSSPRKNSLLDEVSAAGGNATRKRSTSRQAQHQSQSQQQQSHINVMMDEQDSLPMMHIEQSTLVVTETVADNRPVFTDLVRAAQDKYRAGLEKKAEPL